MKNTKSEMKDKSNGTNGQLEFCRTNVSECEALIA